MTVYVDELRVWPGHKPACFRLGSCHMSADTLEELHAFAKRLGLRRAWFQEHPSMPHYDLTKSKRALALSLGAVETTARRQARERMSNRRVRDGGIPGARVADDDGSCFLEPPHGGWPSPPVKKVVRATQSRQDPRQWHLELECGHDCWVTILRWGAPSEGAPVRATCPEPHPSALQQAAMGLDEQDERKHLERLILSRKAPA